MKVCMNDQVYKIAEKPIKKNLLLQNQWTDFNEKTDQCLYFCSIDSIMPLVKSETSSL